MSCASRPEWWRAEFRVRGGERSAVPAGLEPPDSVVPFRALIAFTFIVLLAPQTFLPALAPFRIALLTGGVAIVAHVWDRVIRRRPITVLSREIWLVACLVGWAIAMLPFSYWPGGSAGVLLDLYFKSLAIFLLVSNTVNTLPRLRRAAWALSLMAVPLAVSGVTAYLSGRFMEGSAVKRIVGYDAPLTENPNDLALMLNLILPLTLALVPVARRPAIRTVLVGAVALNVAAVVLTFSRAGFVTLATIVMVQFWKLVRQRERGRALPALLLGWLVVCLPLLPDGYLDRVATITNIEADPTGSAQARWNDALAAVRFVLGNPVIGAGIGADDLALNEVRGPLWRELHNVYLQYAVELGLPGLALFLALLLACLKSVRLAQRRAASAPELRDLFYLAEGIHVSLMAFAVAALFYPVAYHFYFYYLAGLAVAARVVSDARSEGEIARV